jgi:hypothetical protein
MKSMIAFIEIPKDAFYVIPIIRDRKSSRCVRKLLRMVRLNEIKAGNWLCTEDGSWGTVESVGERIMLSLFSDTRGFLAEELWGIKVNRHILSLCNFQLQDARYIYKETFWYLKYYDEGDISIELPYGEEKLAFVHQLQNIFFDITGQLLNPNLCGI